jgi:outer membrane protein assembly factor BamB
MRVRGRLLNLAVLITTLATVGALSTPASAAVHRAVVPGGAWAQTNGDAAQSRDNLNEHTLTVASVHRAQFRRSHTAPPTSPFDPCFNDPITAPVLVDGFVYTIVTNVLTKINAATGHVVWRVTPDPQGITFYTSLSVSNGLVVVGGSDCVSQSDPNGYVRAFRVTNGSKAWSVNMGPGFGSSVVSQGFVVFEGETVASGTQVTVRRLSNGSRVWTHQYDNDCLLQVDPVVVHSLVVHQACTKTGRVVLGADRLTTGKRVWTRYKNWVPVAGDRDTTAGTHLFVTDSKGTSVRELVASNGNDGYTLDGAEKLLAIGPQRVFATCSGGVCGYAIGSGAQQWSESEFLPQPLAAVAGGVLYLGDGTVLRADTGGQLKFLWSGNATWLAVGNGRVAVVADPRVLDLYGLPGS